MTREGPDARLASRHAELAARLSVGLARTLVLSMGLAVVAGMADAQATYTVRRSNGAGTSTPAVTGAVTGEAVVPESVETAAPSRLAQRSTVTLSVKDSSVAYVVRELTRQAHVQVSYRDDNPDFNRRIDVHVQRMSLMDALHVVLKNTGLEAELSSDGRIVVIRARTAASATSRIDAGRIEGRVIDSASGTGIRGATVRVRGLKLSAMTTDSGRFVLPDVPAGTYILAVTALGYRPLTYAVDVSDGGRAGVRIVMSATATVLSGVVTTATGVQRRLDVGSDVTTINVDSVMRVAPVKSLTDLLDTRIPGATVMRSSGTPGDPSRIRLRRAASIREDNNPIVIVDGVRISYDETNDANLSTIYGTNGHSFAAPSALDQIDPSTIEKIDVFKGPSASAMYGSDAANGVIVITTKRGRPGETRWSLATAAGVNMIPGSYPTFNYAFGHSLDGTAATEQCPKPSLYACTVDSVVTFQALNDPRYSPFKHGGQHNATMTVSGGVPVLLYSLTGSASNENGTVRLPPMAESQYLRAAGTPAPSWMRDPDRYTTWSGAGQIAATLSPTATVTISQSLTSSTQQRSSLDGNLGQLIGIYVDTSQLGQTALVNGFIQRALTDETTSRSAGTADWTPRPWLHLQFTGGIDNRGRRSRNYVPAGLPAEFLVNSSDSAGQYSLAREDASTKTGNSSASLTIPLPRGASVTVNTGFDVTQDQSNLLTVSAQSLPIGVTDPSTFPVSAYTYVLQTNTSQSTYGWFVEPQLHLSSRFTVSPGIRLDGGSASGSNAGLTLFPKTSVSWLVLDQSDAESGWRWLLSSFRLRGAYGLAGVQPDPVARLHLYTIGSVVLNGSTSTYSVTPSSPGNTEIRPERSSELEGGFDTDLFDSRASLTFTAYHKKRLNAIMLMQVAPSAGGGTQSVNIGTVTASGVELTASARLIDRAPLQWTVNMSLATSHNALVSLGRAASYASPGGTNSLLVPGYPIDGLWVRPLAGYRDVNGDGIIEKDELVYSDSVSYVGSQDPNYTSTFNSALALLHGRLSMNASLAYTNGLTQYNSLGIAEMQSAVSASNPTLQEQAVYLATLYPPGYGAAYALYETVNTLRLQSASLTYMLPASIARLFRAGSASLSLQGSNLWLHTNYRGKDPDVNGLTSGEGVADFGQIPEPRLWTLSLRLN